MSHYCMCPYRCPDCGAAFVVPTLCHDHRERIHGTTCEEETAK